MTKKDKIVFQDKLKGNWIPHDVLGTPMIKGEILLYATGGGGGPICWRIGKIQEVIIKKNEWGNIVHKLKMNSLERYDGNTWEPMSRHTYLTNVHNAFVLTKPPEHILEIFKGIV